ncbi:ABC transporter ATP-binding protein [Paenibacillus koleovorans]|uniref:ABC transporter ATP-binding protein n=1 Tax=Paenibacillus koleovorans TaxID=121608 RepID=UPI0013E30B09|nr:ABC transporter ATP-binding protein [Paenibacillus koleovorans]
MFYVKWTWTHLKDIKSGIWIALLFMLIENGSGIAATFVQKHIIDDVFLQRQFELLPWLLAIFVGAFLLNSVFITATPYRYVTNEYLMDDIFLKRMLARFFRIPMARIQNERTAQYAQYMTNDLHVGGSLIGFRTPLGASRLLHMFLLMGIVGWHSPLVLLSVTVISLLYILAGHLFAKRIKAVHRQVQDKQAALAVHIEESISATREIIAFHRADWEMKLYDRLFGDYFRAVVQETKTENRLKLIGEPLQWAVTLSVLGFGGYQLFMDQMTLGSFVIVFQFTLQLMESFHRVFNYALELSAKFANVDRMRLLMEDEQIRDGSSKIQGEIRTLEFDRVSFAYEDGGREVLRDFSLAIPTGRKVAFVGASGGGKSTLAQLLMRFYDPDSVSIRINGEPLDRIERADWSKRVRIVFQDPYLMADTVRMNLLFGRETLLPDQLEGACRVAQLHEDIALLPKQYEEEVGERGVQLSGGQKQRLALARAILEDPEVLILDEATSSLDLETERRLQEQLDVLRAGRTTLIIAHRLSTVQNADLIVVLEHGRVAELGTHEELLTHGRVYPKLAGSEQQERVQATEG